MAMAEDASSVVRVVQENVKVWQEVKRSQVSRFLIDASPKSSSEARGFLNVVFLSLLHAKTAFFLVSKPLFS